LLQIYANKKVSLGAGRETARRAAYDAKDILCRCLGEESVSFLGGKPIDLFKVSEHDSRRDYTKSHGHALKPSDGQPALFPTKLASITPIPAPPPPTAEGRYQISSHPLRFRQIAGQPFYSSESACTRIVLSTVALQDVDVGKGIGCFEL